MNEYDVVIVGGGAAGLSAALVLTRARRKVLVIDSGAPRNAPASTCMASFPATACRLQNSCPWGRAEVESYGGEIMGGVVTELVPAGSSGFWVLLSDGRRISTRRLLIAAGLRDELPAVPGLAERWARDVLHCPYCHGYEVRDQQLGVLGGGSPETVRYAQIVRQWAKDVVLFVPAGLLTPLQHTELVARAIGVVEGGITRILTEDDHLRGVEMDDGRIVHRDVLFVPPRFVPNNDLLIGLGCETDETGWPVKDGTGQTTVPGVWIAGNVANPRAQVITAAGQGSAAAIAINADLVDQDIRNAVQAFNEGF